MRRHYLTNVYFPWLRKNSLEARSVTTSDTVRFLSDQRDIYSATTVNNPIFQSMRSYHEWLIQEKMAQTNPVAALARAPTPIAAPRYVPTQDLRKLLDSAKDDRGWIAVALMAFNSLKIAEVMDCNVQDFQLDEPPYTLHFRPKSGINRPSNIHIPTSLAERLKRFIGDRRRGPLFVADGKRLSRGGVTGLIETASRRAKLGYEVRPQMLAYTLPATAMTKSFSLGSYVRTMGLPQRRHAERWLSLSHSSPDDESAPSRLASMTLEDEFSSNRLLDSLEAVDRQNMLPSAMVAPCAISVLERHLFELCAAHGLRLPKTKKDGSINYYTEELRRGGVFSMTDKRQTDLIAEYRNNGAHGDFEEVPPHAGANAITAVRRLIREKPIPSQ